MAILLGIDTGGTFTDAVLYDEDAPGERVLAKAKALTTHDALEQGIGEAVQRVLSSGAASPDDVAMVSLSTTLATNALVEGRGGRVGLIFIGFDEADLGRGGLPAALGDDPAIRVRGGHRATGELRAPLDLAVVEREVRALAPSVEGFAVVAIFGGRNPEHEIAVRDCIRAATGLPVTCGHELSNALHGPRNAVTSVLNARLIGLIAGLIAATEGVLTRAGIAAPLMLVRGDGSLVSADFARLRPIETILSGPAASLVGAAALTGLDDAMVSDIGGTTTDIAILARGRPSLDPEGATVGGHRTMVEAVAMRTHGLGGDSEVALDGESFTGGLTLGPRRVMPVSLLGMEQPELVQRTLERQAKSAVPGELDGRFVLPGIAGPGFLSHAEAALVEAARTPAALDGLVTGRVRLRALERLVSRGQLRLSGLTPSDAAHVLGLHDAWDAGAAMRAAALFARRKDRKGRVLAPDARSLAERVVALLHRLSGAHLLDAALQADGLPIHERSLIDAALAGHRGVARLGIGVSLPIVALGASAASYYPPVARMLETACIVPAHAEVANAVGAVAGRVRIVRSAVILASGADRYRASIAGIERTFTDLAAAKEAARASLVEAVEAEARNAGAADVEMSLAYEESAPEIEGRVMFVEGRWTAEASARPRFA